MALESFPRHWHFVKALHRPTLDSPNKGPVALVLALMFSLMLDWRNGWNIGVAGELRHHNAHYDVSVMGIGLSKMTRIRCLVISYLSTFVTMPYAFACWYISEQYLGIPVLAGALAPSSAKPSINKHIAALLLVQVRVRRLSKRHHKDPWILIHE